MKRVALSLGSNLNRERSLSEAIRRLSERLVVLAVSSAYETNAVGPPGQPAYYNAAMLIETDLEAPELKHRVLRPIEASLGRRRTSDRYQPRTIDIDITLWGHQIGTLDGAPLPDPGLLQHLHLALPLAEIAPDSLHPVTGEPFGKIASRLLSLEKQGSLVAEHRPAQSHPRQ